MAKRLLAAVALWTACAVLLVGCGGDPASSDISESTPTAPSSTTISSDTSAPSSSAAATTTVAQDATHTQPTDSTTTVTTTVSTTTTARATTTVTTSTTATDITTTTVTTTTMTSATETTAPTTANPHRATVNGKAYAVGDTLSYTVMVKTAENYGTVKIGIRCVQKGLEIPDGTFQKQNQAVMKNIGIGRLGTMPEDTVSKNGFTMTAQKGYALDAAYTGYAGLLWYYETTNYDYTSLSYRQIDCSEGMALFTIALKITKAGDYLVECMEYPQKTRTDLTVWGEFS